MSTEFSITSYLHNMWTRISDRRSTDQPYDDELPLRSELFSADQMALYGKALASGHVLAPGCPSDQLLSRLADNERTLVEVCTQLTAAVAEGSRVTPAAEWLLDNFYLIEEQIGAAKRLLPKGYSLELPRLGKGPSTGRPRVYDIALKTIAHGDGRVDAEGLSRFVASYQTVTVLNLGELWAIPIMLRLAVIENLRRVGVQIAAACAERKQADVWADRLTKTIETDPNSLILAIADMVRSEPPMVSAFVAEFVRRLQRHGQALALPLTWIEQRLAQSGLTIAQLVQAENQRQAADQVSISNSIGSLRVLGAMDWRDFVESMSLVEQTLLGDPGGAYEHMDFATRDRYRHATEEIARKSDMTEVEVAREAVGLARAGASDDAGTEFASRSAHVGYYLVGRGRLALERATGVRLHGIAAIRRYASAKPLWLYLGAAGLLTVLISAILLAQLVPALAVWAQLPAAVIALLAASQVAIALVNWLTTLLVTPRPLPRLDYSLGIPATSRTLVVVPTLLTSAANVDALLEALEVRFLANPDDSLHFALLTDFLDADQASLSGDAGLVALAREGIDTLNVKYPREGSGIFLLLHRPRRWNPQERIWMGWERKRGKLADLNALLRGRCEARFSEIAGDVPVLSRIKYVITLDTDTQLPRDAARLLVAAMDHPLNRPRYDIETRRVVEGYGILQPGLGISLPGASRSRYAHLYAGEPGIDPYTRAISDVYQDVFGEGSFNGKGIYDVDAFERAMEGLLPENRILSHDLLEGCHARSGLISDVLLYEDFPARYSVDVSRRHRWIRGDWQLAAWLKSAVPCACPSGTAGNVPHRRRNPLSLLSQWKLTDNLRRSLVPSAVLLLFVTGCVVLPAVTLWTLSIIAILLLPGMVTALHGLLRKPEGTRLVQHLATVGQSTARHLRQVSFELACLPYEAWFSLDAILRTLWRMSVSHRRLLQWQPSSEVDREASTHQRSGLGAAFRTMAAGPAVASTVAIWLAIDKPDSLLFVAPLLLLWFASPAIAWWISRPVSRREAALTTEQTLFLRTLARRTWTFFDTFVGPADHWLPPDNFQQYRKPVVAHRTSPTNIGLALLANLAAYDFGYLPAGKLAERSARTLETMAGLERYRGHFYNWYDTQTLLPLPPRYISTVDSGNLAGHLLTLQGGLLALADDPILPPQLFDGLNDTLELLFETSQSADHGPLIAFRQTLNGIADAPGQTLGEIRTALEVLADSNAVIIAQRIEAPAETGNTPHAIEAKRWAQALAQQVDDALAELTHLAPWLQLPLAPPGLADTEARMPGIPTLQALAKMDTLLCPQIGREVEASETDADRSWLVDLQDAIIKASSRARDRITRLKALARQSGDFALMEYDFLFDKSRHLLTIGYNVQERRADGSCYDLLASEVRLASFVAIAQGQLPQASWFALGRLLTSAGGKPVLLSWSGSMFEYLMPLLVMPTYDNTLLDQTCKAAVARQIDYGQQRGVPWGISESAYNTVDTQLTYQYRAFGVPGLGLKRGLGDDLVVAPYASVLALMVAPEAACRNLKRLAAEGFVGQFGLFEAIDYTPSRQRRDQEWATVHAFMAHHQGMSLLALAYEILNRPMQQRFESNLQFQAVMLLLQERIPKTAILFSNATEFSDLRAGSVPATVPIRHFTGADTPAPEVQLLSNGSYHVMLTNSGAGYSRWKDLAVTRWREDGTQDNQGTFCYVRDLTPGGGNAFWSTTHQPTLKRTDRYEAIFSEGRAEFRRWDRLAGTDKGELETYTEIVVSPEDDIELRRIRITNCSRQRRDIELTSYAEVVIAPPAGDALHPAFSKLFVQTEILAQQRAILCMRRPRSANEPTPWMMHLMIVRGPQAEAASFETDRLRFIGRTRTTADPAAMHEAGALSGTCGSVLDPIAAIRQTVSIEPEQTVTIDIVSGMAPTREMAVCLVGKFQDRHMADRVFDLAWTHSLVVLQQINASESDAMLYARLAGPVIHANARLRSDPALLIRNRRGQSGLWGYAISGDLPIVLLQIGNTAHIDLVRHLVQAHAYWRLRGLAVDLVIWNEDHAGYRQHLQEEIIGLIASDMGASVIDQPGGIFVRPAEQISAEDRLLFHSVARVVITDGNGSLEEQLDHRLPVKAAPMPALKADSRACADSPDAAVDCGERILFNGSGGFTPDGREYVITLAPGQVTPAPWVNVLANAQFGTIVSESGSAYTWSENAHEFRLTPWHNDPVSDPSGEALYLRDEESGLIWSPTPLPVRAASPYVIRHGFGYSVFETRSTGIHSRLTVFVAQDAAVKFMALKLRNDSPRPRRLSATAYIEWVLGDLREKSAMHVSTELASPSGALYARNPYGAEFGGRVAFLHTDAANRTVTGDRAEFLGRNGSLQAPAALKRTGLSGRVGAGFDPCGAMQVAVELAPGEEREIVFRLGAGTDLAEAAALVQRFSGTAASNTALDDIKAYWRDVLGVVQIATPDPGLDVLVNGWLIYQVLGGRLWARSGYYQSGGAFGFRDQLQDVMALVHAAPGKVRAHLLLCASRQFVEGDVQHWWHPPTGRGVRTRCSDDFLWLPLAVSRYVMVTGDHAIVDESVRYLEGRLINSEDESYYDLPGHSSVTATLYDHCVQAIRHGLRLGVHGLPLMGSGDWNDGMNRVGLAGKGESIWLGFFLCEVLRQFAALATNRGDTAFATLCTAQREDLQHSLEAHGWDGEWYLRAYFDDGSQLGSAASTECRIDSISQSWAVLSGAADPERARTAMNAVDRHLVRRADGLIQLLDPPFDSGDLDPGYIRGYVPGVRENGGQYTHAAVWTAMAFAEQGDERRAWELLTLINPVNHALTAEAAGIYKVEPYVVAADVYACAPHTGRGGWSWHTGAAGWMYRLTVESLLGLKREGDVLHITPRLPADWPGFTMRYRHGDTSYNIVVSQSDVDDSNESGVVTMTLDGNGVHGQSIRLVDDNLEHGIQIQLCRRNPGA